MFALVCSWDNYYSDDTISDRYSDLKGNTVNLECCVIPETLDVAARNGGLICLTNVLTILTVKMLFVFDF